jgi:hypothetical protein
MRKLNPNAFANTLTYNYYYELLGDDFDIADPYQDERTGEWICRAFSPKDKQWHIIKLSWILSGSFYIGIMDDAE